jgi:carboxyl-terminal processing protease
MLKTKIPIISLIFALFLAIGVLLENVCAGVPVPQENYGAIAKKLAWAISVGHLSQRKLDDGVSAQAWTNLMDSFDFDHSYFLMSDVNALTNTMFMIDDMVKDGDVSLPYDIYAVFRTRVEERYCFVTNLLAEGFDFKIDEDYEFRWRELPWALDRDEQNDIWRKRIKNEVLAIKLSQELNDENATNQNASVISTNKPVVTAEENVSKRYKQFMIIIQDMDSESILQRFLSAVAYAYDPHSDYMSPMRKEDFDIDMNLSLCGIGASLRSEDGMARIMEIIPGGPADRDKREIRLARDDKIIGVGQGDESIESILHMPLNRAVRKIRGEKGTKVVLEVIPASDPSGSTTKIVDLVRDEVKLEEQAATGRVERVSLADGTEQKIGYVRLPTFYATMEKKPGQKGFRSATDDIARYMAKFNSEEVVGMVLDLRNNGGGSLREAISLTGLFIRSGPVVQVREMNRIVVLPVPNNAVAFRKPLAVLINRASASASEIVAGALQDYGRAVVIGDSKSHGKGTVQTVIPLGDEDYGSLKVTTASFYRINGASTQRKGVQSDIVIPSRFEGLDIGEDKMPNALPWTEVAPARYVPVFDMQKFIPKLKTISAERLAANDEYRKYSKLVERFKEAADRKRLPLHIEERRQLIKSDRALQELEGEITDTEMQSGSTALPPESEADKIDKAEEGKDLVFNEALLILTDLIRLSGGGDLNMETEGDLASRIMQIFGGKQ